MATTETSTTRHDPVAEYVARVVAAAPPVSEAVRQRLAAVLGGVTRD